MSTVWKQMPLTSQNETVNMCFDTLPSRKKHDPMKCCCCILSASLRKHQNTAVFINSNLSKFKVK